MTTYPKPVLAYFHLPEHNTENSVFTLRFSKYPDNFENSIVSRLRPYIKKEQINRLLVFKEGEHKNKKHIHIRFESKSYFFSLNSVHKKLMATAFKDLKGNKQKQSHACKIQDEIKDKFLGASKTYIAKEGKLVFQHGYNPNEICQMVKFGKMYADYVTLPIYRKIIVNSSLKKYFTGGRTASKADWGVVVSAMQDFYETAGRGYIQRTYTFKNIARNIMLECCYTYRIEESQWLIDELYHGK